MSIRVIRLVIHKMYMKYRMHSAGSFGCLIKINVTFRNADQMCMCVGPVDHQTISTCLDTQFAHLSTTLLSAI